MPNSVVLNTHYWKIALGKDAWQWQNCRDKGFIAMGWDELGDISNFGGRASAKCGKNSKVMPRPGF